MDDKNILKLQEILELINRIAALDNAIEYYNGERNFNAISETNSLLSNLENDILLTGPNDNPLNEKTKHFLEYMNKIQCELINEFNSLSKEDPQLLNLQSLTLTNNEGIKSLISSFSLDPLNSKTFDTTLTHYIYEYLSKILCRDDSKFYADFNDRFRFGCTYIEDIYKLAKALTLTCVIYERTSEGTYSDGLAFSI